MNNFCLIAIGFCLYPIIGHIFNYFYYKEKVIYIEPEQLEEIKKKLGIKDDDDNNLLM